RRGAGRSASARARDDLRPRTPNARPVFGDRLPRAPLRFTGDRQARAAERRAHRGCIAEPRRLYLGRNWAAAAEAGYIVSSRRTLMAEPIKLEIFTDYV